MDETKVESNHLNCPCYLIARPRSDCGNTVSLRVIDSKTHRELAELVLDDSHPLGQLLGESAREAARQAGYGTGYDKGYEKGRADAIKEVGAR